MQWYLVPTNKTTAYYKTEASYDSLFVVSVSKLKPGGFQSEQKNGRKRMTEN